MAGPIISKLLTDFFNEIGQKATWLRSSGLECFAELCDHRQRYCGAVVPVTRLALVAFGVFSGTGHAPR